MAQFGEFFINHWPLFVALVVISAMLAWNVSAATVQGVEIISPLRATQIMNHDRALVLDIREDSELAQGKILDAMHIPLGRLASDIKRLEKHKQHPVIVCCRVGNRSMRACGILRQHGFDSVYNLRGGVQAWQNADLPLLK